MLKSRVWTSLLLAAAVIAAIVWLSTPALGIVLGLILFGIGGWEGARLAGVSSPLLQALWILALGAVGWWLWGQAALTSNALMMLGGAQLFWPLIVAWLLHPEWGRPAVTSAPAQFWKLAVVAWFLLAAHLALVWIHHADPLWLIYLIVVIAAADIGAFFVGTRIGGRKLAPRVSPGKTWAGLWGGLGCAVVVAAVAHQPFGLPGSTLQAALVAAFYVPISVAGDLLFSLLKRHRGLKDTSELLPGHGGLLDRLDSLGAAAPAFALGLLLMQGG